MVGVCVTTVHPLPDSISIDLTEPLVSEPLTRDVTLNINQIRHLLPGFEIKDVPKTHARSQSRANIARWLVPSLINSIDAPRETNMSFNYPLRRHRGQRLAFLSRSDN